MNRLIYVHKPRKFFSSLTVVGELAFDKHSTFSGSGRFPSADNINPKNETLLFPIRQFGPLILKPFSSI